MVDSVVKSMFETPLTVVNVRVERERAHQMVVDGTTTARAPSYTTGEDDRSPTLVWRSSGGGKPELQLGLQAPTPVDPSTEVITVSVCKCY
ncbi:hypothetical protein HanIR_Chr10g0464681 [Helianthus annuus]|nr:hypothetical protein HanIR_Chr10g0464681 [Helianthus annuus]